MNDFEFRHVRACVAFVLCASMVFGMFFLGTGFGQAAPENAVFKGNVKIGADPAPDTLIMYSVDVQSSPAGNSTLSNTTGDYEIWVEGGSDYYLYFANGAAMFDANAQIRSHIGLSQTKYVNATLNSAPTRTVTVKGYLTNASDASPVTGGHVLALRAPMGGEPDYINWTEPDVTGYFETMVLSGPVMAAVFDAPGYFPGMGPSSPLIGAPGDTVWINISLTPLSAYTVNITGYVMDSSTPTPLHDAVVTASFEGMGISASNYTDMTGYYLIQFIDGYGGLDASAAGYVSQRLENLYFSGNMSMDFYLNKETAEIHGYVTDEFTGQPIADANVRASAGIGPSLDQFNQTITDSNGYYSMNISDGIWFVDAEAMGYGRGGETVSVLSGENVLHNITLMPESGKMQGYVTDLSTSLPIDGATVRIRGDMLGRENMTVTDPTGYFEMSCLPDSYEVTFIADGYMWETTMSPSVAVGANETLWLNHSLEPATVLLFGTVKDAVTGAPISGASVTAAGFSQSDPDFMRVAMTSSVAGNYSMMVAYDTTFTVIIADHFPEYRSAQWMTSIPDVTKFEFNISLLPSSGVSVYWLEGYVTDSTSGIPIDSAYVEAVFGMSYGNATNTDMFGYYGFWVATVELTVTAYATGYLPAKVVVSPGAPNATVVQDFALDPHLEPPMMSNETIVPDTSISVHNHANLSVEISEPYLSMVQLILAKVTNVSGDTAWLEMGETYTSMSMWGTFLGDLQWQKLSPGEWRFFLPDWDATSDDMVLVEDGTGAWEMSGSYGIGFDGIWRFWGQYSNSSLMFPRSGQAAFDPDGNYLGFEESGIIDPGTITDMSGEFWMGADYIQFNLTTGRIMSVMGGDTIHLEAPTMHLQMTPMAYPSGDYAAIFMGVDVAENRNFSLELFSVDSDPPFADAGANQTQIVDLMVTLNASASIDNVAIVNYTWTIEDGTIQTLWGAVVDYTFTTTGNHTATVVVTDAAGNSASASVVVDVLADQVPVADAGADQIVDEDTVVHFDGTGSHDDIGITNYTWTIVGSVTIMYGPTPNTTFTAPGNYHVRLVVTDTVSHASVYDEVVIAVVDVTAPVADAGDDQTVNVGTAATFDATGSTDNAGVTQYTWTFTDNILRTLTGAQATYTFATHGDYVVTLTVRDAEGNQDTDTMIVHVNEAPAASAGPDQAVATGAEVTFDGTDSTDDIEIMNYSWSFTYKGTQHKMYGASPKFTFDEPGTYEVQLTVRDVGGLTDTDSVTVTVTGGGATSFLSDYWWALLLIVVVIGAAVAVMFMRKGKGPSPKTGGDHGEVPPPPPAESDELQFPPPNDEEL